MSISDAVKAAIEAGHVKPVDAVVEITDKASPTGKGAKRSYTKLLAQDAQGMAAMCDGKINPATDKPAEGKDERTDAEKANGAADYFNYGYDLQVRQEIRQALMGTLEGPEKQIKKSFDGMLLAGYSKDEAAELVRNSPKFKGVDGLDAFVAKAVAAAA